MRQVLRSVFLGLACVVGTVGAAGAQAKIGYVNTQAIIAQTPARATAETEFNRQIAPLNAEAQRMDSTLKAMFAAFTRDTTSPVAQREARAAEIQQRQQQYQARMEAIEDSAAALRQRLMQPMMQALERALEEVRREGGYALIFDVGQSASIVAADTTLDVTAQVLAKMGVTPAANPPRPTGGPVAQPAGVTSRPPSPRR